MHKPLLLFGIERTLFVYCIGFTYMMHYCTNNIIVAVVSFIASLVVAYYITQKDPAVVIVLQRASQSKAVYDAAKERMPRVEIL